MARPARLWAAPDRGDLLRSPLDQKVSQDALFLWRQGFFASTCRSRRPLNRGLVGAAVAADDSQGLAEAVGQDVLLFNFEGLHFLRFLHHRVGQPDEIVVLVVTEKRNLLHTNS